MFLVVYFFVTAGNSKKRLSFAMPEKSKCLLMLSSRVNRAGNFKHYFIAFVKTFAESLLRERIFLATGFTGFI